MLGQVFPHRYWDTVSPRRRSTTAVSPHRGEREGMLLPVATPRIELVTLRVRVRPFRGFLRATSTFDRRRSGMFSAVIRHRPLSANLRDRCGVRWQSQVRASSKITCFARIHLKGNRDDREHMKSNQSINWASGQPPARLNPRPAVPPCRETPPGSETKLDHVYSS